MINFNHNGSKFSDSNIIMNFVLLILGILNYTNYEIAFRSVTVAD